MKQQTVVINGVTYDAHSGMRLKTSVSGPQTTATPSVHAAAHSSSEVHAHAQKSRTLNRKFATMMSDVKKPKAAKHPMVTRFTPDVTLAGKLHNVPKAASRDISAQTHPHVAHAAAARAAKVSAAKPATAATLSSTEIKQRAVSKALAEAPSHNAPRARVKTPRTKTAKLGRGFSLAGASLALLLLAGYFTYFNMPNLSVRVAAAQAGINASYPAYHPDGYNLHGPVAYNSGRVSMKFASTGGPQSFTLTESRSVWDSTAVEQNYAQAKWGDGTNTIIQNGLTIYTHNGDAAWVNGGILYTISGNAPLSNAQLSHIAVSM